MPAESTSAITAVNYERTRRRVLSSSRGLASDDAEISSSAGTVEVTAVEPPRNLVAESSAGDVRVTLPDEDYNLDADSSAGDVRIEVPTDPNSDYRVRVHSSAGDVTVTAG